MEDKKEIDRQFDRFLTRMLDEEIPAELQERLRQSLNKFRPPMPQGFLKGISFPPVWKYAVLSGLVLALLAGIYLYYSDFQPENKVPLQTVCLKTKDSQHCDLIENQSDCLARLLKECIQAKVHDLALHAKIDSRAIDIQVAEETDTGRCGKQESIVENQRVLKVVVQIKDSITLAQKENLVRAAINHCPLCEDDRQFACVSYQILE
jgi:hypothetical protein